MAGTCECGNELSGSIKCGEFFSFFFELLRNCYLLRKDSAPWSWKLKELSRICDMCRRVFGGGHIK